MHRVIISELRAPRIIHIGLGKRFASILPEKDPLREIFDKRPPSFVVKDRTSKNNGLFQIPELCDHTGFNALHSSCSSKSSDLLREAIDGNTRKRALVQVFDELSDTLCQVADMAEFIRCAHISDDYKQSAADTLGLISGHIDKLNTNKELYLALNDVVEAGDKFSETSVCKRVGELFLLDFQQSGIHLDDNTRKNIVYLNNRIMQLGQLFTNGCHKERLIERAQVPHDLHKYFSGDDTHFRIHGIYAEAPETEVRKVGYGLFLRPDEEQDLLLTALLEARAQLAHNCGYQTYTERCLRGSLLDTPETVLSFLDNIALHVRPKALAEMDIIRRIRNEHLGVDEPMPIWDMQYYSVLHKSSLFSLKSSDFCVYFSLGSCMQGLSSLFRALYGITLNYVDMEPGESWAPDIYKLEVTHETEGVLGTIYCDFFKRSGKVRQESLFTIRGGRLTNSGTYQMPIVVVMLDLPKLDASIPCLLTPSLVDTLFHEMGHAMHSMLGRTRYQHVAGTRCSTDVAEVPSVLMEYFARDPRVLRTFARHFNTDEPMPEPMMDMLRASRPVLAASEMLLQTFYSALDQRYHGRFPLAGTTSDILAETQNRYYCTEYVSGTAWQHRFGHLYGYGGKYYSYLASRALASWIWSQYFVQDPLSRENGERLRREFLCHGGAKPPGDLIADFLAKKPTPDALAQALVYELDEGRCPVPTTTSSLAA